MSQKKASETQIYKQILAIPSSTLNMINDYLDAGYEDEFQSEDETIIYTAKFPDGKEVDVKCCGCQDAPSWTEAVLFDSSGYQLAYTEPSDEFTGPWELEYNGITYIVDVIPADSDYVYVSHNKKKVVCPICGEKLQYDSAHDIQDEHGIIPWECQCCGATGKRSNFYSSEPLNNA